MRRRPVTRDEIRFNGHRITTLPIDSVREDKRGDVEPIAKLWAPLLRALNRVQKKDWDSRAKMRERAAMAGVRGFRQPDPISIPQPYWASLGPRGCHQCGNKFYRTKHGSERYCSDACAAEAWAAKRAAGNLDRVKRRAAERAAVRANRRCETCGEPIEAQRSTMRFCSVRCRVTAHRKS